MKLLHYSNKPLLEIHDRVQYADGKDPNTMSPYWRYKPSGLWVTIDGPGDWKEWCEGENFRPENLACVTEVVLKPDAKILHLRGGQEAIQFTQEYQVINKIGHMEICRIDWGRVAQEYDGFLAHDYDRGYHFRFARRMEWYSTLDCSSGAIWRGRAVQELRSIMEKSYVEHS